VQPRPLDLGFDLCLWLGDSVVGHTGDPCSEIPARIQSPWYGESPQFSLVCVWHLQGVIMGLRKVVHALIAFTLGGGGLANAAEIKVIGGSAVAPVLAGLIADFERTSGHKVQMDLDGAIGAMVDRVRKGAVADVVIVSGDQIDALIDEGKVVAGSRTDIGEVGIGLFVRNGAPKRDISSVEAFEKVLHAAKSIGYNDPAAGAPVGVYLVGLFERLGIAAEMESKTVVFRQRSERFEAVARGDVEIGFNQISEIVVAPGIDLVGPLPKAVQRYTLFSGGILAGSREQAAGKEFVTFIAAPQVSNVWRAKGFEVP
jgi:molybdate transport system substrate-binding protein